ncbi:MAG TPA: sigma 54-interacting transcriptional regulator [Pseudomonadales bacterium]|nr:sigma 54-interacting transcriptional regulator [Pseudomonadales bacterium]
MDRLLTYPDAPGSSLSIRAKALSFHDAKSLVLLERVERLARTDATVLVIGETGTGKELIARHLHQESGRKGPFLAVNCGAFSESLIDAELFGHEAGAYTGATQARPGWFEAANGGTLFLDEMGDLPMAQQVKLLRVLQERQVTRIGSRRAVPLDVRLVAATNIDLRKAVEAQRFRADLYFRISVATVELPPLRERPGDIVPLAQHFIAVYGPRLGLADATLDADAVDALEAYGWPGNIRELENVVHCALIVCRDGVIRVADLGSAAHPLESYDASTRDTRASRDPARLHAQLRALLRRLLVDATPNLHQTVEALLVQEAFAHSSNNQVHSARALGLTRNTLRTLLKRHGLLADSASEALLDWAEEATG